ncbi:MAG: hypothetical protein HZY76_09860 [Anaerolineae bacterium]|nr:MAG: hypothetical protein HZY76_09860 [Anaerolineae bacterium]
MARCTTHSQPPKIAYGRRWRWLSGALGVKPTYRLALAAALETLYVASQVHETLARRAALNGSAGALVLMGDHLYARRGLCRRC